MVEFSLSMGPVWLQTRKGLLMLGVSKDEPLPTGIVPKLHGGMRADHLTIPLEPRKHGEHSGRIWIHLTYPDGAHEGVAAVSVNEIQSFAARVEDYVKERILRAISRVSPAELAARGYYIIFFDDEFPQRLTAIFKSHGRRKKYRVSSSRIDQMVGEAWVARADVLEHPAFPLEGMPEAPFGASCWEGEAGVPDLFLKFFEYGPDGQGPGWFAWNTRYLPREFIAELLHQHVGPPVWDFIKTIATELGLPLDFEKVDRMLQLPPA